MVKFAKDIGNLEVKERKAYFDGLSVLGNAYLNGGHSMIGAFNIAFPNDTFGKYRESIAKDTINYLKQYERNSTRFEKAGVKTPKSFNDYATTVIKENEQDAAIKSLIGLTGKKDADFKNIKHLESARRAVAKIAQIIGIEKATRYFPFFAGTGKAGGTSALPDADGNLSDFRSAEFYLDTIEKQKARKGLTPKQQKDSDAIILKSIKAIEEGKEPTSHPYGLFAGMADLINVAFKGLTGYAKGYKSTIPPNASQSVGVVNKDFSFKENKESADRSAEVLVDIMDAIIELQNTFDANGKPAISKNDIIVTW